MEVGKKVKHISSFRINIYSELLSEINSALDWHVHHGLYARVGVPAITRIWR